MSFYVVLPSGSSAKEFPGNLNSHYKTKLVERLVLTDGRWEVALVTATYPNTWRNLTDDSLTFFHKNDKGVTDYQKVDLPKGTVSSPTALLTVIKRAVAYSAARFRGKVLVDMEPVTHKCWVSVKANYGVVFSQNLADILGLKTTLYSEILTEGSRPIDVMAGLSQMYIYSSVVATRPVGDASASLLRELVVKGRAFQPTDIEFIHPHYVDAKPLSTDVVEIQIADALGRPYDFYGGRVSLTLHFRKRDA